MHLQTPSLHNSKTPSSQFDIISNMKSTTLLISFLLFSAVCLAVLAQPIDPFYGKYATERSGGNGDDNGMGGFFGPGGGFNIPGFGPGMGGGYGVGYGGPGGGYSRSGTFRSSVVCKQKGPCYKKKLTCPAKCFSSYSRSGKGYGYGGGGGGCTIDCQKRCVAYC